MSIDFETFKLKFKKTSGLDLNQYKQQQLHRRINQWLARVGAQGYGEYLARMERDKQELEKFLQYLTINTSQFYRDERVFDAIHTKVLPELLQQSYRLKIWSAGSSVGAEIYTLAILLEELSPGRRHTLLGTDFDEQALAQAKAGVYGPNYMTTMSKGLLEKYFTKGAGDTYVLDEQIRKRVVFKQQDLLKGNFEGNFDLILCRNVFIYFTVEAQERLTAQFSQSLRPGGYFIVGSAESLHNAEKFDLVRREYCIYQKQ